MAQRLAFKKILTVLFLLSLSVGVRPADACSVMEGYPGTPQENYNRNDVVFVGKVTSFMEDEGDDFEGPKIQFELSKVYKGDFDNAVVVTTAGSSAACGYDDVAGTFTKGSVWAIYADKELRTSSIVANKKYATEKEALAELDALEGPKYCTMQYAPVCGRKDTGVRCVTTPCDSSDDVTYGNLCAMNVDKAEFLYDGECREEGSGTVTPPGTNPGSGTVVLPTATSVDEVIIDVPTSEEFASGWKRFWEGLKKVIFFWR